MGVAEKAEERRQIAAVLDAVHAKSVIAKD